jgi:MFS family permease
MIPQSSPPIQAVFRPDSRQAWIRLWLVVALASIGSVGSWSSVVALPYLQAEFGGTRGAVSLLYTSAVMGFGLGGAGIGRLTDRAGIVPAIAIGIACLLFGYVAVGFASTLWQLTIIHFIVGVGSSATFAPLMAEVSHWFVRRRGIAVSIAASGNYIAGAIWPPLLERGMATYGWRWTHIATGLICAVTMSLLLAALRRRIDAGPRIFSEAATAPKLNLGMSNNTLTVLLSIAAIGCCTAMAMPQVHIVAYCGDLGYGVARGAEMLALMLGFGIVSRIGSGFIADRIGGLAMVFLGSIAQAFALALYLGFSGLASLYVISILFGLFQGGIVPSYALVIRETMPANEAATRVGIVILFSVVGMALGGWMSGVIFDATGSYTAAFINGIGWNALNLVIIAGLIWRRRPRPALAQ